MDAWFQRVWYGGSRWRWALAPLSILFWAAVAVRRMGYRLHLFRIRKVARPVIVVGNIVVGGVGKTPLVMWLAERLQSQGHKPGIISRGYGGRAREWPLRVEAETDPALAGDETVLIAQRTGAIVIAGPDRVAAATQAIALGADVIISDDGLQHYRLARDFEIAVVDGARGFGNGWLLPAGPLRERRARLNSVDAVMMTEREGDRVVQHELARWRPLPVRVSLGAARSLLRDESRPLGSFRGSRVHAIAAIGNPEAFFTQLRSQGLDVDPRPLPDHAQISSQDLSFEDALPILMTEKDAVKCRAVANERCWAVPLRVEVADDAGLLAKLDAILAPNRLDVSNGH